jgi:hypothetical protein
MRGCYKEPELVIGNVRCRTVFLLLPRFYSAFGRTEWRWLERARIVERYGWRGSIFGTGWFFETFADEPAKSFDANR